MTVIVLRNTFPLQSFERRRHIDTSACTLRQSTSPKYEGDGKTAQMKRPPQSTAVADMDTEAAESSQRTSERYITQEKWLLTRRESRKRLRKQETLVWELKIHVERQKLSASSMPSVCTSGPFCISRRPLELRQTREQEPG
jgi:hypothetical protein